MARAEALRAVALAAILLLIWLGALDAAAGLRARLCRGVRHGGLQRRGTGAGALAGDAASSCRRRMRGSSWRAPLPLRAALRWAACWSAGSAPAPAFGFAAALSAIAVVLLPASTSRRASDRRADIRCRTSAKALSFVLHHSLLRPLFVTQFIFNTGSFLLLAVFVPYAVRHLGLSATGVGATLAMYGVGMVIGALLATRVMRRLAFGTVIGLGPVSGFVAAARDGADDRHCDAAARGLELLPARRRPDPVGDLDHDVAAIGDAATAARPGLRDQHPELWRASAGLRDRRHRRRALTAPKPASISRSRSSARRRW